MDYQPHIVRCKLTGEVTVCVPKSWTDSQIFDWLNAKEGFRFVRDMVTHREPCTKCSKNNYEHVTVAARDYKERNGEQVF